MSTVDAVEHTQSKSRDTRLDSWKEIAAYLKRDIRTVQRWEKLAALPVHRHQHLKRGSPFAYTGELDAWWEGRGRSLDPSGIASPGDVRVFDPPAPARPPRLVRFAPWIATVLAIVAATAGTALYYTGRSTRPAPIRRLSITLPPETEMRVAYRPTISPSGHLLALVGYDEKGTSRIWVRALDSLTPALIPGTEGAEWPFWSPDSKDLGFFAGGKLKVVTVATGQSRTVSDAPNGRGGTWSGDTIVFAPFLNDGLYSVAASGGSRRPITTVAADRKETSHRWPQFLPDGKHFIFFVVGDESVRGTYTGTLDTPGHALALRTTSVALYSAGYLLFRRDSRIAAQAFDQAGGRVHGEVLFLPDRIGYGVVYGISYASASDNGLLVYLPSGPSVTAQLTWYDRSGNMLSKVGPVTSGEPWLALAPNGEQAAVQRWDEQSHRTSIWLGDLERRAWSRFIAGESGELWPVWSPDGRRIAFGATRSSGLAAIYERSVDGSSAEKLLVQEPTVLTPMDWSPDGQYLLFQSVGTAQTRHIKLLSLQPPNRIVQFPELDDSQFDTASPRFAPDGRSIAYASNESGSFEIYVRPFPFTTGSRQLVSTHGGYSPRWRADGKELFYLSPDRQLMSVPIQSTSPMKPGMPKPLFELPVQTPGRGFVESPFDVSSDGKRFLVGRVLRSAAQPLTVVLDWTAALQR